MNNDLREAIAAYSHDAWAGWMKYQLTKATINADGSWTIPPQSAERWQRQMTTDYKDLPESERLSDLAEADRILSTIGQHLLGHNKGV
jgi:hypothetical protein